MPTIYLPKKKVRVRNKYSDKKDNNNHKWVYNTSTWRTSRLIYLMDNPLCEDCLKNGKLSIAVEVHHIIPISTENSQEGKKKLGFDFKNLRSLCSECHKKIHKEL